MSKSSPKKSTVKRSTTNSEPPKDIREYITKELWNAIPKNRQREISEILRTPTTYFFRRRCPWEPSKTGPFTPEEEKQFFQRYNQLKEMGIVNAQWGFFAISFVGRVGYQLATFYRTKVSTGEIQDDSFVKDSNGSLKHIIHKHKLDLTPEMKEQMYKEVAKLVCDYAETCLKEAQTQVNTSNLPIKRGRKSNKASSEQNEPKSTGLEDDTTVKNQEEADDEREDDDYSNDSDDGFSSFKKRPTPTKMVTRSSSKHTEKQNDNKTTKEEEVNETKSKDKDSDVISIAIDQKGKNQHENKRILRYEDDDSSYDSSTYSSSDLSSSISNHRHSRRRKRDLIVDSDSDEEKQGGLYGAYDFLTERPMRHPAMNLEGYVLDFDSWKKILSGKRLNPFNTSINSLSELTLITPKNYEELKYDIVNSPICS